MTSCITTDEVLSFHQKMASCIARFKEALQLLERERISKLDKSASSFDHHPFVYESYKILHEGREIAIQGGKYHDGMYQNCTYFVDMKDIFDRWDEFIWRLPMKSLKMSVTV